MAVNATSSFEPYTLRPLPPLIPGISDQHLSLFAPIAVHWLTSGIFEICDRTGWLGRYRLHTTAEELAKNRVTRLECLRVTIQCQASLC
jgi:sphinganine C4-monooxygenase